MARPQRRPTGEIERSQRRPSGPMWAVDDQWKRDVEARMMVQGVTRTGLARTLGVSPASITQLFSDATKQTRLKPAIHKALGLVAPSQTPAIERDEALQRLMKAWKDLSDEQRDHIVKTSEMLVKR